MDNNFDRTQLLKTALKHTSVTIDELASQLGLTPILLYHNLESEENSEATIKNVAALLRIPRSYFSGAFYYNDRGELVPAIG